MSTTTQTEKEWYTVDELAARWGVSKATIWRRIDDGSIRYQNRGTPKRRLVRIPAWEVERLDQETITGPTKEKPQIPGQRRKVAAIPRKKGRFF